MNGLVTAVQGRLSRDAELKFTSSGTPMLTLNLAVNDSKKPEDAPTEWLRAVVWGDEAERLAETLKKGREAYCEGRLKLRTWTTSEGVERSSLELSAWTCVPLGAIGRQAPRRQQDAPTERRPRAMPEAMALVGGRNTRQQLGLDDDDAALRF